MKFKKGDLVTGYEFHPRPHPHPRPHLHLRLRPHLLLRPRLRIHLRPLPSDYGIVVEAIDKKDAWMNFDEYNKDEQAQIQHCYVVHWQRTKKESLIYEDEIERV